MSQIGKPDKKITVAPEKEPIPVPNTPVKEPVPEKVEAG